MSNRVITSNFGLGRSILRLSLCLTWRQRRKLRSTLTHSSSPPAQAQPGRLGEDGVGHGTEGAARSKGLDCTGGERAMRQAVGPSSPVLAGSVQGQRQRGSGLEGKAAGGERAICKGNRRWRGRVRFELRLDSIWIGEGRDGHTREPADALNGSDGCSLSLWEWRRNHPCSRHSGWKESHRVERGESCPRTEEYRAQPLLHGEKGSLLRVGASGGFGMNADIRRTARKPQTPFPR